MGEFFCAAAIAFLLGPNLGSVELYSFSDDEIQTTRKTLRYFGRRGVKNCLTEVFLIARLHMQRTQLLSCALFRQKPDSIRLIKVEPFIK